MKRGARNPKLFGSSYVAPTSSNNRQYLDKSWRAILIVVALILTVFLLGRLPMWRLKAVELRGDQSERITKDLNALLGQSIFSSSVSRMISRTKDDFAVDKFDCRRGLPATLRCDMTLRKAEIIWESEGTRYSVDKNGVLFATHTDTQSNTLVVEDTLRQPVKPGSVVASPEIIMQYKRLVELLLIKQLTVTKLLLNESMYQITVVIERPGKNPINGLFLLSGNADSQVEALALILATKGDSISERVDVRVQGYVYTK